MATRVTDRQSFVLRLAGVVGLLLACCARAAVEAEGTIVNQEDKVFKGLISYKAGSKSYQVRIQTASGSSVQLEVAQNKVKSLTIDREPEGLRVGMQQVRRGEWAAAISNLDLIASEYNMMQYDLPASRGLAFAYLQDGKAAQAIRVCERMIDRRPEEAVAGETASIYLQALLTEGRNSKLEDLLNKVAAAGTVDSLARVNVIRGEMLRKQNKPKEALRDGYLRTVVLYRSWRDPAVREARAEALFKAAQCFDELGQVAPAGRMRTACLGEHPESVWARRLKAGER
jgi:tetratricopeptide (TPR) repeat protein